MTDRPPLTLTEREMQARLPTIPSKASMAQLGGACYVKHFGEWVLLDAQSHGYGADDA